MRLFQAALDTPLDSSFFATLSVHGLHFTVCAPSIKEAAKEPQGKTIEVKEARSVKKGSDPDGKVLKGAGSSDEVDEVLALRLQENQLENHPLTAEIVL